MNYQKICEQAIPVIKNAGQFIREQLGNVKSGEIEVKALNSLVSYVDKSAEERLVKGLSKILPEAVFLTEEKTIEAKEGSYRWIIDPLDGTTNFLHQLPVFSVSVALQYNNQLVVGIVFEINQDECFYAWQDGGAYLNGQRICVSSTQTLSNALIATGFPYYDYDRMANYIDVLKYFMQHTRGIRRLGSAAVDLAYVACGRFDAFYEYSLNAWDIAAGTVIVREAGGQVADFQGQSNYLFGRELMASNNALFEVMKKLMLSSFYK
ncbi:MAG: inositol monophosphatase [Saprospiraceae bacterium]|nr:inositol monophosphatase [Saprospiraceae bacterium]